MQPQMQSQMQPQVQPQVQPQMQPQMQSQLQPPPIVTFPYPDIIMRCLPKQLYFAHVDANTNLFQYVNNKKRPPTAQDLARVEEILNILPGTCYVILTWMKLKSLVQSQTEWLNISKNRKTQFVPMQSELENFLGGNLIAYERYFNTYLSQPQIKDVIISKVRCNVSSNTTEITTTKKNNGNSSRKRNAPGGGGEEADNNTGCIANNDKDYGKVCRKHDKHQKTISQLQKQQQELYNEKLKQQTYEQQQQMSYIQIIDQMDCGSILPQPVISQQTQSAIYSSPSEISSSNEDTPSISTDDGKKENEIKEQSSVYIDNDTQDMDCDESSWSSFNEDSFDIIDETISTVEQPQSKQEELEKLVFEKLQKKYEQRNNTHSPCVRRPIYYPKLPESCNDDIAVQLPPDKRPRITNYNVVY
jgi:hypothetical protein